MKKAIVIGASSGIGRALAKILGVNGYEVGLVARRLEQLQSVQKEISAKTYIKCADVSKVPDAQAALNALIDEMNGVDLIVVNSGVGFLNPELTWEKEKETLDVNVNGFCAMAVLAFNYFEKQGHGHLVGISSIAALMGNDQAPAYNASKAFVSNYLAGLRKKAILQKANIVVTDIKPGYVDTALIKGSKAFWSASPEVAAEQIYLAIRKQRAHAYITRRWRLVGWLLKAMPEWLFNRLKTDTL